MIEKKNIILDTIFKNSYKGKFVVFEGIDGSGKTTQINLLANFLKEKKKKFLLTKEPTDDSIYGKKIKKILDKEINPPKKIIEMQKLFVLDRRVHLKKQIIPALKLNKIVLSDRYFLSTFVYGMLQGLSFEEILKIHRKVLKKDFILPDLIFILDLDPKIALLRIKKSRKNFSYFEKLKKLKTIRKNYILFSKIFPNCLVIKRKSIKKDAQRIRKIFQKRFL